MMGMIAVEHTYIFGNFIPLTVTLELELLSSATPDNLVISIC